MSLIPGHSTKPLSDFGLLYGTAWKKELTTHLVTEAINAGFRGVDTACQPKHYQEHLVGDALFEAFSSKKIRREDFWIQTKYTSIGGQDQKRIPYDHRKPLPEQVAESVQVSLKNLKVEIIDSLVMHSPEENMEKTLLVWRAMEGAVHHGYVHNLGISNCYSLKFLQELYNNVEIKPIVIQNRFYGREDWDRSIRKFCLEKNITYQSFWTLTANPEVLQNANFREIAEHRQLIPAQLLYKFLIDIGCQPLSGTTAHKEEAAEVMNLNFKLTDEEIAAIDSTMQ